MTALSSCPDCGKPVSLRAQACPHCGAPIGPVPTPTEPTTVRSQLSVRPGFAAIAIVAFVGIGALLRAKTSDTAAPPSAGIAAALRQPTVLFDEAQELRGGGYVVYPFDLSSDARVQVAVTSAPEGVDVMLMTEADVASFKKATRLVFGGGYTYRQALSNQNVKRMDATDLLPAGRWAIVVQRPGEPLLGRKTTADIKVTVY